MRASVPSPPAAAFNRWDDGAGERGGGGGGAADAAAAAAADASTAGTVLSDALCWPAHGSARPSSAGMHAALAMVRDREEGGGRGRPTPRPRTARQMVAAAVLPVARDAMVGKGDPRVAVEARKSGESVGTRTLVGSAGESISTWMTCRAAERDWWVPATSLGMGTREKLCWSSVGSH